MFYFILFIILSFLKEINCIYHVQNSIKEECSCYCSESVSTEITICQKISKFEKELSTVKDALEYRTRYINDVHNLKEKLEWQEYTVEQLIKQVESLSKLVPGNTDTLLPISQPLIMNPEDQMQNEESVSNKREDVGGYLMKNMSKLMEKVEEVENITMEFQEELKTERRVRRHIEDDLSEARSSIKLLGDKLSNFSNSSTDRHAEVEEIVFNTFESMNRTFFEDHLQKLYYKVDGVAYKNETKKLVERMNTVEAELHLGTNSSTIQKLAHEVKLVSDMLSNMNETFNEKFASDETRFERIESNTNELEGLKNLSVEVNLLLNTSDSIQKEMANIWNNVRNTSEYLIGVENRIDQIESRTTQELKMLAEDLIPVKMNLSQAQQGLSNVQNEIPFITADVVSLENKLYELSNVLEIGFKDVDNKLDNVTINLSKAFETKIEDVLKYDKKKFGNIEMRQAKTEFDIENKVAYDIAGENDDEFDDVVSFSKKDRGECSLPTTDDDHLLIALDEDKNGVKNLNFACYPIGQYVLSEKIDKVECIFGEWQGSLPVCKKLLSGNEIEGLAEELDKGNPCRKTTYASDFADPTDCSRYFRCWRNKSERTRCKNGLHFNPVSKRCQPPSTANCVTFATPATEMLKDLVPTILIDPDNVDKANSLIGTNNFGHLVVYPRTSFKLRCVYPDNMWGVPKWYKNGLLYPSNELTMVITSASKEDSGVYSCVTPFGKENSVTVSVEVLSCPEFDLASLHGQSVFYRPHPEGMVRVLSTQAQFKCDNGRTISATCWANGMWSRMPPTEEECPPQDSGIPWNCSPLDITQKPNLVIHPVKPYKDKVVMFNCTQGTHKTGSPFTRCKSDGSWSHKELPDCTPNSSGSSY